MIGICWKVLFLVVMQAYIVSCNCLVGPVNNCNGCWFSPCKNGTTCNSTTPNNKYSCVCPPGYTGPTCDIVINLCDVYHQPCKNNATCTVKGADYFCSCLSGFTDQNCSTYIRDSNLNPCQNWSSCQDGVSQYRCHCAAGEAGCVCFNTSAVYNYTVLHDKGVQILNGQTSLKFEVQACISAHVLLMKSCLDQVNDVYEIVIGEWSNTVSVIRIADQQNSHNVTFIHTVEPLNCSEMNSFWIDWKDNVIQVGNGSDVGSNQFMYLNGSGNMTIQYLAISTLNHTGYWMFNASKCTVTENTTIQTGDKSTTDTQTASQTIGNTVISLTEETTTKIGDISITDTKTTAQTTGNTVTSSAEKTTTPTGDISTTYINTTAQTTGSTVTSVTSTASSRNTHNIVPSTPTVETTETIPAINSTCSCPCRLRVNQTETERAMQLKTAIELIRRELKMEKKNLSSTTRKKTCARDERVSAKTMGFTLGVCVLTTVFGSIIMWDIVRLGQFIWKWFH